MRMRPTTVACPWDGNRGVRWSAADVAVVVNDGAGTAGLHTGSRLGDCSGRRAFGRSRRRRGGCADTSMTPTISMRPGRDGNDGARSWIAASVAVVVEVISAGTPWLRTGRHEAPVPRSSRIPSLDG